MTLHVQTQINQIHIFLQRAGFSLPWCMASSIAVQKLQWEGLDILSKSLVCISLLRELGFSGDCLLISLDLMFDLQQLTDIEIVNLHFVLKQFFIQNSPTQTAHAFLRKAQQVPWIGQCFMSIVVQHHLD